MAARRKGLRIASEETATPSRVAALSALVIGTLDAMGIDSDGPDYTLVVRNRSLVAELRAQLAGAEVNAERILAVARNPEAALEKDPEAAEIALALADVDLSAFPGGIKIGRIGVRAVATIDKHRIKVLRAIAEKPRPDTLTGSTEIVSKVVRLGSASDGGPRRARVLVEGRWQDIGIHKSCDQASLVRAYEAQEWCQMTVDGRWRRIDGRLELNARRSEILRAEAVSFATGSQFLEGLRKAAPSLLDVDPTDVSSDS